MRTLTFTLDTQTGDDGMAPATVTITETENGELIFTITNEGDGDLMIGDLRGLFFDVADDNLLGTLSASGSDITEFDQSGDVNNLGGGSNSSGVPDSPYEIGIEFGTSGMAVDDIQTTTFTLSSSLRSLTLDDIALESFTVRQTSVGPVDGDRSDSDKLWGDAPYPVNAIDDTLIVDEDDTNSINVFANDIDLDAPDEDGDGIPDLTITAINGDASMVDQPTELMDGVVFVFSSDGVFTVDATDADYLSEGESITETFYYTVDDGNGGSDTAEVVLTINGANDAPEAVDDVNTTDEDTVVSGNVIDNDSDIDRLDTFSVAAINGDIAGIGSTVQLASGALVTLNSDGTYDYDPNGAFDYLNDGETALDTFTYEIVDNHGATATATVEITINGVDDGGVPPGTHFGTFSNKKGTADHAISNVVLYMHDGDGDLLKVKIDGWNDGETDLDNVDLGAFMDSYFGEYDLLAVSIKAGNNHNRDLGPGEGQLFLLDGDEDIDYLEGGAVPAPFTSDDLSAKADVTFDFSQDLFV